MDKLELYNKVNAAETIAELENAIIECSKDGVIMGRIRSFDANEMASYVKDVVRGTLPPNFLTREYGIRQQALYLKHYNSK